MFSSNSVSGFCACAARAVFLFTQSAHAPVHRGVSPPAGGGMRAPARRGQYFSLRKAHTPPVHGGASPPAGGGMRAPARRGQYFSLQKAHTPPVHGGASPAAAGGMRAPARRGRARGGGTPCSPSSCQSPPLPSGRAARVMAGNAKQLPPVCRTGQSLPFRTPRGKRSAPTKEGLLSLTTTRTGLPQGSRIFAAVPVSGALRQQSVRRPKQKGGDPQEGGLPPLVRLPRVRHRPCPPTGGVMAGNTKQLPPVCRRGQSLPFRTPRGERVHRPKKFFSP